MRIMLIIFVGGIVLSVHPTGLVAQSLPDSSSRAIESTRSVPRPTALVSRAETRPDESETERRMSALEDELRLQKTELEQLRKITEDQQLTIRSLMERLNTPAGVGASNPGNASSEVAGSEKRETTDNSSAKVDPQAASAEERLKKVEDRVMKIGPFRFSGDFRLRLDGILRSSSEPPNPALAHVQNIRARYRLRLNFDTDLYSTLSFHGQLATGPVNNPLTFDQDFSAVTVRHPFFLSEAWINYHPKKSVQIQAGRVQEVFADNSRFLFDDDIRFNGFNEKYVWSLKHHPFYLSSVDLRAGQYILTNPNVAVITPGSPLDHAAQVVGTTGRSANLFHQGILFGQQFNHKWSDQFGADVQLFRNPNQIALASTSEGLVLLIQPGIGIALSGPPAGAGTATTTPNGAIYSAGSFKVARLTYQLNYAGFERANHIYPIAFNFQVARNAGTGLRERDALIASAQVGRITKRGDLSFLAVYSIKGANSLISQVTDDDLGTGSGVNIRTGYFRFEYGVAKKVTLQSLFFVQKQLRNSGDFPNFFVPLGAFAPRTYRFQQQLVFVF